MSDDSRPEAVWVFPEKKNNRGRIWLIVGLVVATLVIVAVLLFFLVPRGGEPEPTPGPTTTKTAAPTPTATPTPTVSPTQVPVPTQPPVPDPDIPTFAAQVQPRLDDASTGLSIAADLSGQEATQVVETLQQDAGHLSGAAAPSSISSAWYEAVGQYRGRLGELRAAIDSGSDTQSATRAAAAALQELRALVGL